MMMDAGLDTGDILLQSSLPLDAIEDLGDLETKLAAVGADLLMETLAAIGRGDCPRIPQDPSLVTLAPSLPPETGALDWSRPAIELHNLVRGVTPKPGAYVFVQGKRLKVWRTEVVETGAGAVGTIETLGGGGIIVHTSEGALRLCEVQPESKGRMGADAWARGVRLAVGQSLE